MWSLAIVNLLVASAGIPAFRPPATHLPPHMDMLMLFNFLSALVVICCWIGPRRSNSARMIQGACLLGQGIAGLLTGAWSLGILAIIASLVLVKSWRDGRQTLSLRKRSWPRSFGQPHAPQEIESRVSRLFGPGSN